MSTPPVTQDVRFSEAIKTATWSDHSDAESTGYVHQLFKGELSLGEYTALVVQHYPVYVALEAKGEAFAADPVAAPFVRPEIARVPALEADLAALLGADWRDQVESIPSTRRYVERIEAISTPGEFLAHHYTRYLGDLSGGLMIGRAVSKAYGFGDAAGAKFYVFDGIADPKAFKEEYRENLDALPFDDAQRDALVAEVVAAYKLNADVLVELGEITTAARG